MSNLTVRETKTEVTFHLKDAPPLTGQNVMITPMKVVLVTFAGMPDRAKERSYVEVTGPMRHGNLQHRSIKYNIYGVTSKPHIRTAPVWLREMVGYAD